VDLRLLRYFLAVIDHGGVTRAAQALYVAQPSVSQTLRTLEQRLGVELFERVGRGLVLTAAGRELEFRARQVLLEVDEAQLRVDRASHLEAGRVTVAAASTLAIHPLGPWVGQLLARHPGLQVHVVEPGSVTGVLGELRDGAAEIGLVELPVHEASLETVELPPEELVLVAGPRTTECLPDPVPRPMVATLTTGTVTREQRGATASERAMRDLLGRPRVRCAQRQLLWDLVQQDVVATFVPRAVAQRLLPGAGVRSLDPPLFRRIGVVYRPGGLAPAARALLEIARPPGRPRRRRDGPRATGCADPTPDPS
jgi:DNA-binding transcriptional LysR family regulator